MIRELIIIVVGTTAFCLLFHLPKRHLPLALFGTALCWGLYRLLYARIDNLLCAVLVVSMFSAAYAELVASYTPEQREVIRRMTEAKRQARLCRERARWPEGSQGTHPSECAWPEEPAE